MLKYIIKRFLWMIPMLIGISLISFLIMQLAPGDITTKMCIRDRPCFTQANTKLAPINPAPPVTIIV